MSNGLDLIVGVLISAVFMAWALLCVHHAVWPL